MPFLPHGALPLRRIARHYIITLSHPRARATPPLSLIHIPFSPYSIDTTGTNDISKSQIRSLRGCDSSFRLPPFPSPPTDCLTLRIGRVSLERTQQPLCLTKAYTTHFLIVSEGLQMLKQRH